MKFSVKNYFNEKQLYWLGFLLIIMYMSITHFPIKIEKDIASLLGDNFALSSFLGKSEKSIQVLVVGDNFEQAQQNSERFYESLDLDLFSVVRFKFENREEILKKMEQHRYGLLNLEDRKLLLAGKFDEIKENAIRKFKSSKDVSLVDFEKDPFYLFSDYMENLSNQEQIWQLKNGYLTTDFEGKSYILITLKLKSIDMSVVNYLREKSKVGNVFLSGAPFHTVEMIENCERQIEFNLVLSSFMTVFLVLYLLRHIKYIVPILLNLTSSFFVGYFSIHYFEKTHIVVFVFATSLICLSVGYSFHYFSCHEDQYKQLVQNIFQSFCTTIFCFVPLLFTGMPILKQIATFSITGLATVFLNTIILYPSMKINVSAKNLNLPKFSVYFSFIPILFVLSLFIKSVTFNTDIQTLYNLSENNLKAEEFFEKISQFQESKILVVAADYLDNILEVEEQLKDKSKDYFSLATIVPSKKRQKENTELVKELFEKQLPILKKELHIKKDIAMPITYPLAVGEVWEIADKFVYLNNNKFHSVTSVPDEVPYSVQPKELMKKIMKEYAQKTYKSIIISTLCLLGMLIYFYRKKILFYMFPSILSLGCLIAILGWMNVQINLFHVLSFFIVFGLGIDYAIFNLSDHKNKLGLCVFLSNFVGLGMLYFVNLGMISSIGLSLSLGLLLSYVFSLMQYKKKVI